MIGHLLNADVDVYRSTYAGDGAGGRTKTTTRLGRIRASVGQPTAEERTAAAERGANLDYVVHVQVDANVDRGDELDTGSGRRLRVVAVVTNSRRSYLRLECQAVQADA